jgi:hypothetical protein
MEFREYASKEVATLIERLAADAEARAAALLDGKQLEHETAISLVRVELEAEAAALLAQARELESRAREAAQEKERLATASEETQLQLLIAQEDLENQRTAREALALELELRSGELEQRGQELEERRRELEVRGGELEARGREKDQLAATVEETQAQIAMLQAELAEQQAELERQRAEVETQRREAEQQRQLAEVNAAAELQLLDARAALEAAQAEARAALEAAQADAQRLTRQFETALEELRDEHVNTLQQQAVARTVLPLDELLTVFESLASASTPSAILTTVVSGLGREFSRVALFRVRGARLECVSHVGFEFEGDVAKVVIPTSVDSLMTRAVTTRKTQTFVTGTSDEPCPVPFGGTPACAVALPLISGDAPVAVVYADDSDQLEFGSVPAELLVKFAELVWQHAILVLQRASAAQKTLAVAPAQSFERLA